MKRLLNLFLGLLVLLFASNQVNAQGVRISINIGGFGFRSAGPMQPSPHNVVVMQRLSCPQDAHHVSDTGIFAGLMDERVDARSNWNPNFRGGRNNRSSYGRGTFRRDREQTFSRTIVCARGEDQRERTVSVTVRITTDNQGFDRDEDVRDTNWQQVRQNNGW